jgi:drug/metabolite transporter (DMT)-like permease
MEPRTVEKKYSTGVLLCLVATVSWGAMFPVMTGALRQIDPFTFTCLRYTIAGIVFVTLLVAMEGREALRLRGERVGLVWFLGTAGFAGFQFLVFYGQQLAGPEGALIASIMMATMPLLGILVNWLVRNVVPPRGAIGFILMSFFGVTLVVTKGHYAELARNPADYGPDALIIAGALCWVIYTVGAASFPGWSPVRYTTMTTLLGLSSTYAVTIALLGTGEVALPGGGDVATVAPELAYMSLVAGVVGVLAWNWGNKILTPLNGVLFMDVVPITAFTISALTGVIPAGAQVLGAVITASALICNNLYLRRVSARAQARAQVPAAHRATRVTEPERG